ncbi:MAG: type II toxin-antitoxin system MqsA family antitoxin [Anaerolineae bacterium]|nr:type II toxin-antitoxin system MqsA family antitoxin [Anaerolineae bacterium]
MSKMTRCYFCKGKLTEKKIHHVHHWGERIVVFEDVPAEVCQQCGEVYFRPEVLEKMDEAVLEELKPKARLSIPVFSMPELVAA